MSESSSLRGFGNAFSSSARDGALPPQNSPQRVPFGLFAEQLSGTAFTAPRHENRRTWMYRLRPSAAHPAYREVTNRTPGWKTGPFELPPAANRLRWDPLAPPEGRVDFLGGVHTLAGNGSPEAAAGIAMHRYSFNASMRDEAFFNADADQVFVPQTGTLEIVTELGRFDVPPGFIGHVPRGMRMRIDVGGPVAGYLCENYGAAFVLPELGPIGANGLANPHDFESPSAAYTADAAPTRLVQKLGGHFYATDLPRSPFDVVAWRGNLVPYRYDLSRFNTINTVSFDHPDPSIFTVLTSPGPRPGTANCDFVIFPPRWMVAEHTFRPPWFHRNVMSELMGLIHGTYDAKASGFSPGSASLHNSMSAHGPDRATYEAAIEEPMEPRKIDGTLAFMFETCRPFRPAAGAVSCPTLQPDYDAVWSGFE
ncbi:MAG: homogentisate 1,2-dioxygenase [Myxococcota bacterium]